MSDQELRKRAEELAGAHGRARDGWPCPRLSSRPAACLCGQVQRVEAILDLMTRNEHLFTGNVELRAGIERQAAVIEAAEAKVRELEEHRDRFTKFTANRVAPDVEGKPPLYRLYGHYADGLMVQIQDFYIRDAIAEARYDEGRKAGLEEGAQHHDELGRIARVELAKYTEDELADDYSSGHGWRELAEWHEHTAVELRALAGKEAK